ncbi:sclerostin domain-containing protein 1a [Astyanax mexicanus]|uniref:Sclerostin domain-containing protein 1 n=2 Tax=Astyanax mexicanus TaxID=7994 RepID=A0A8B9K5N5_ASTMX|nr:sclerostin domain-containing protein 1a [Astyanax mexicanus]KAG9264965.1 sclerostin domain-containing protein 1 [Astyanax mexicanus]
MCARSEPCSLVLLMCVLLRSAASLNNHNTELRAQNADSAHTTAHSSRSTEPEPAAAAAGAAALNRARSAGRGLENTGAHRSDDRAPLGCRELRSTKYISDGQCTSINPIKELVCAGECLPAQMLPNWIGGHGRKSWNRRSSSNQDWRCVNDKSRTQRIQLQCLDGSTRTYKITVVTGCKCKRYLRQHNESGNKSEGISQQSQQIHKPKSKRKHGKTKVNGNWPELEP